jgi:hypothetical protein
MLSQDTITLAPRGWQPNPNVTGGDRPPYSVIISRDTWEYLGRPATIEDFLEAQSRQFKNTLTA